MTTEPVRVSSEWLALREPADAAARSRELVEAISRRLPSEGVIEIHDMGCGTGSMARWLAPQLPGPQHWVCYDRDAALLARVDPGWSTSDGRPVTLETRQRDIARLDPGELAGASLITASALLDMMTAAELQRLVAACATAGCAVLITLSVTGRVDLAPADPLDQRVAGAFNAHQRRKVGPDRLLGPDAIEAAVEGFRHLGLKVMARSSPWRLGADSASLAAEWFIGWLAAAREQEPELGPATVAYARRRLSEARAGRLSVTVHHQDLLARA